jgi:hypothetical protein
MKVCDICKLESYYSIETLDFHDYGLCPMIELCSKCKDKLNDELCELIKKLKGCDSEL